MKPSIRKKYRLIWITIIVSSVIFSVLTVQLSQYFLIPWIFIIGIIGFLLNTLKCSCCQKPVLYKPSKLLGKYDVIISTPWIPKNCTKCGEPIN